MFCTQWKKRALAAEQALQKRDSDTRATLVSITRNNRTMVLTFMRNGEIFRMTAYCSIDINVAQWQKLLID